VDLVPDWVLRTPLSGADAGSAGVGSARLESKLKPIEILMACQAGRISIGEWS